MMLDSDKIYHELGPKDMKWGKKPIAGINLQKTIYDGEAMSVTVPIFESDDRETMKKRVLMFETLFQERMQDFNQAMLEAEERAMKERKDADLKLAKK